jgi:hypothetical protein
MARIKSTISSRKPRTGRGRHLTPPPDLSISQGQAKTPQRCGVLYAKLYSQEMGISIPQSIIRKVTGVPERNQSRILASKQPRTCHNQPDSGPDPRGRKRAFTRLDTSAISDYLDDYTVSLDDKGLPWLDIAEQAGVDLPETFHFKPPGLRTVSTQTLQRACKADEDLINAICEEEKELTETQAKERCNWVDEQLLQRPRSKNWKDVAYCDEFHFGVGPQTTKRIKRKRGPQYRYKPENVHRKKVTAKDTKAKAREEDHLKLISVFVVIGYNYRKIIRYTVPNSVGKMTTKVYTEDILPALLKDFQDQGLTLCQDADSAHTSKTTIAWAKKHGLPLLTLPGVSPDLSILESLAHPLKKAFHSRRCVSEKAGLARFTQIFEEELDQKSIQHMYNYYTKRLHDCRRARGQMTKY